MYASHNLENWCVRLLDRKKFHHLRAIRQKNESSMSEERLAFEKFNRHKQPLDEFFMKQTAIVSYTYLLPILKLVLLLSHGQANVEKCFSISNNVLKCTMSEKSVMLQNLIIDHMKSHNLLP